MAQRVVLHIGSMKSGTSFIQNVLGANKDALAAGGVLFPGPRWRAQVAAVKELIGHGGRQQPPFADDGPWRTLVDEVNAWDGTAVISMEFLGPRNAEKIRLIQESFPGADLQVVLTGRDLTRNVPAMWLESVQNGSTVTWSEFLDAVAAPTPTAPAAKNFYKHQDLGAMARRWVDVVGRDHFVLVTVPPKGAPSDLLWRRFAEVLGVDPGIADLDVRANPAIGLATAQVLRSLNEQMLVDGEVPGYYDLYVKHLLAKRGLVSRQKEEPRLGFDTEWGRRRAREVVDALRALDLRVIGDLEELQPVPVPGVHADDVPIAEELTAAVAGLAHMVHTCVERDRDHRKKVRQLRRRIQSAGSQQ